MGGWSGIVQSSAVATVLFSVIWNTVNVEGCYSGRYGRYENWPSVHDWEELLALLTGKYWDGGGGWGWSSTSGLGGGHSSSFGGGGGLGSFSSGYQGGSGGSADGGHFSSPASQSGGFGGSHGSDLSSTVDTEKMKQALSAFFNKNKHKPVSSTSFGSGGIGQSFLDSPGYGAGPSHPKKPAHYGDPPHSFGPSYDDSPSPPAVSGWPGSSSHFSKPGFGDNGLDHGPQHSFNNDPPPDQGQPFDHDPTKDGSPYHNPSPYDTGPSHDFGPPYGTLDNHGPPYDQGPSQDHGPPRDHGPSYDHPGPFIDDSAHNHGPPRENHYSRPEPHKNKFNNNQFQSDYDTFGGFDDKRRRQGRRRWFDGKAGLPTKPKVPAHKALRQKPPPPPRRRMQRNQRLHERHQRMSRRKMNTSFGGYKVDHSRLRYG